MDAVGDKEFGVYQALPELNASNTETSASISSN